MALPPPQQQRVDPLALYLHPAHGRHGRALDEATERFVDETRAQAQM
jgi:hypothetical protein